MSVGTHEEIAPSSERDDHQEFLEIVRQLGQVVPCRKAVIRDLMSVSNNYKGIELPFTD